MDVQFVLIFFKYFSVHWYYLLDAFMTNMTERVNSFKLTFHIRNWMDALKIALQYYTVCINTCFKIKSKLATRNFDAPTVVISSSDKALKTRTLVQ